MSGSVFAVNGIGRFSPGEAVECPEGLRGVIVKLKPSDGPALEVEAEVACQARKVAEIAGGRGGTDEIPCPMKKATLSKVVEYLRHYAESVPAEIVVPLASSNLLECGASKWDNTFINVDKEALFDLLYAANALDISGLAFLAGAKASAMMMGKSTEKIWKEFNLSNDLPENEAYDLMEAFRATRRKHAQEDSAFWAYAGILAGVQAAADRNAGLAPVQGEAPGPSSVSLRSWRHMAWRAVALADWTQLAKAPAEVRSDRELLFTVVPASHGAALHLASEDLRGDHGLVLAAVKSGGATGLSAASQALRSERAFVEEAIELNAEALGGAAEELRRDRSLVLAAVGRGKGLALKGAAESLRADSTFVCDCVEKDPQALLHAAEPLLQNKDFVLSAVAVNPAALQYAPPKFKADREVVAAAAVKEPATMSFGHPARRFDVAGPLVPTCQTGHASGGFMHAGIPLSQEAVAKQYMTSKVQKHVVFTAMSTMTPNMGQSNYIAANAWLDKIVGYERPETDAVAMSWGTVGGMGMRWKAFASQDFMNATPDLLLSIPDCCKILCLVTTRMDPPEWMGAQHQDENSRAMMLRPTAGTFQGGENAGVTPSTPLAPVATKGAERIQQRGPPLDAKKPQAPLGGWPLLSDSTTTTPESVGIAQEEDDHGPSEGARVRLTGLKSQQNLTGVVLKCYTEGKCRIKLDGDKGNALVKTADLMVLAF